MELFEQIRRRHEFGGSTIRSLAKEFGVHRRLVRQALTNALPPPRQPTRRPCTRLEPAKAFIDAILEADRQAPRKQRHTAHRIYVLLCQEQPQWPVAESTVRGYVRRRKQEMGLTERAAWVPQCYGPGEEAQVDWYEAWAEVAGAAVKVQIFSLRSMFSGGAFHRAYLRATQQAFLEAHELAFAYYGGVFSTLRYDNLGSAVKKVLRGYQREEHTRFIAFRSHWRFEAAFCAPARPQEKGGVEGEVGYFRRNHLVPMPRARNLEELNRQLLEACRQDQGRRIGERRQSVGGAMEEERPHLQPLAAEGFELEEVRFGTVDGKGCVKVATNWYSTPLWPGSQVRVKVLPAKVEIWQGSRLAASHDRCYQRGEKVLELEHYLDVLQHKPGALVRSVPLAQWREQGRWPASMDRLWQLLQQRHGQQDGTRAMIELLQLGRRHGYPALLRAVEAALELGCSDSAAVHYLLGVHQAMAAPGQEGDQAPAVSPGEANQEAVAAPAATVLEAAALRAAVPGVTRQPLAVSELGRLARYERPLPVLTSYDQLLGIARSDLSLPELAPPELAPPELAPPELALDMVCAEEVAP